MEKQKFLTLLEFELLPLIHLACRQPLYRLHYLGFLLYIAQNKYKKLAHSKLNTRNILKCPTKGIVHIKLLQSRNFFMPWLLPAISYNHYEVTENGRHTAVRVTEEQKHVYL